MTKEQISELHNLLVDTCIKYLKDNDINDVDRILLSADSLQYSKKHGEWTPATDSCLTGYDKFNHKLFESM